MSYKSQLYPLSSTCDVSLTKAGNWRTLSSANLEDMKFLRSWFVYDSDLKSRLAEGGANWNKVAGFALMAGISLGGWSGVALLLRHFLK
jgi:hypothetical protein